MARQAAGSTRTARIARSEGTAKTRAVHRVAAILRCFDRDNPQLTLTDIAARIDLNRATTHRFISSLETEGLLARVGRSRKYQLGPTLVALGGIALKQFELRDVALPFLERLSVASGHTVHLAMLEEDSVVYLEKIEPPASQIQIRSQVGSRRPLHCTALGKAMLSTLPEQEFSAVLERLDFRRYTSTTITSPSLLREEIAVTRQRGWALDNHELNELLVCVAASLDTNGQNRAAISITMIGAEVGSVRFHEACDSVRAAAAEISAALRGADGGSR